MLNERASTLDTAHAAMVDDQELAFAYYERLMESELFMILEDEADDEKARPLILDTSDLSVALVFDSEERLAEFAGEPVPYLALSGRKITAMLMGEKIGLGVNLGTASENVLAADIIDWLAETLGSNDSIKQEKPIEISAPLSVPKSLVTALDGKLANMSGVVGKAYLVAVKYEGAGQGHLLALAGVTPDAQNGVAEAMSEALLFSGVEAGQLDVTYLELNDPSLPRFAKVGLEFEIPELILPKAPEMLAPGMDPDKPPKLR